MDFADGVRKFILSDGRALAYGVYGLNAPSSEVSLNVFYFHGFPASRLEAALWHDYALPQKIRIIAPDRPGMGHSAMQQGRKILDWPKDVLELADHLGIQQFSVLGVSGGGPYALACAREIPVERLKSVAICCGIYPLSFGTQGMILSSRMLLTAASWSPGLIAFLMEVGVGKSARNHEHPELFEQKLMKEMESRPQQDRACLEDKKLREGFIASVKEAFRVSSEGAAWEAKLLGTGWEFELESIEREKVLLWHGKEDVNCPVAMAEKAEGLMKGAKLISFDDETHISLPVKYGRKVLEGLAV